MEGSKKRKRMGSTFIWKILARVGAFKRERELKVVVSVSVYRLTSYICSRRCPGIF